MENRANDMQEEWIRLEQNVIPEGKYIVTSLIQHEIGMWITQDCG